MHIPYCQWDLFTAIIVPRSLWVFPKIFNTQVILQDMGLVADLAKILKQAEQTVPDFLQGGGTASYKGNKYGGSDIRVSNESASQYEVAFLHLDVFFCMVTYNFLLLSTQTKERRSK